MLLLNFSHPLTDEQQAQVEALAGSPVARLVDLPAQFDHMRPFAEQVEALVDQAGLSPQEWQTAPILINPPALNCIAVALLAHLHGRMGYFPPVVRLRPVPGSLPPRFEVAELINLQALREAARARRGDATSPG
ncbi:MAG: CRISPR-associated protein Csx15, partial [Anaerolineae bacterium]